MQNTGFRRFSWGVLVYNLGVIMFGAYVRATGSGAGCGSHWPLCNGEVIPRAPQIETIIEFTHRMTSGLSLLLVIGLFIWAMRAYPAGHTVRLGAGLSLIFTITEALVGAGLVLFRWTADDTSTGRAFSIVIHLLNTFMLLASLALTAWWASGGKPLQLRGAGMDGWMLMLGGAGALLIGSSGALAALGDTLFPVQSIAEGIRQDFSSSVHFLIRLRILHPIISIVVGLYLVVLAGLIAFQVSADDVKRFARLLVILVLVQLLAGFINVLLLAPWWMQLLHLLLADLVWITLILLMAVRFALTPQSRSVSLNTPSTTILGNGEIR